MSWGALLTLLLRALPDILFLWRHRVEHNQREEIHDDVQEFRAAIVGEKAGPGGALDRAAELLERRVREARLLRGRRPQADPP